MNVFFILFSEWNTQFEGSKFYISYETIVFRMINSKLLLRNCSLKVYSKVTSFWSCILKSFNLEITFGSNMPYCRNNSLFHYFPEDPTVRDWRLRLLVLDLILVTCGSGLDSSMVLGWKRTFCLFFVLLGSRGDFGWRFWITSKVCRSFYKRFFIWRVGRTI